MLKILFLIHDLGQGGAEKVLVNLVNNMDKKRFDITVLSIFGGGVNEQFLKPDIKYKSIFKKTVPGNSKIMKFFSPKFLHKLFIKERYDIEISYLEGPSARIVSGCSEQNTKLISWIHSESKSSERAASSFRNQKEMRECYGRFDLVVGVSEFIRNDFCKAAGYTKQSIVLYNTVESNDIIEKAKEPIPFEMDKEVTNMIAVGTLKEVKGFDRLLSICKKLKEERYMFHLYLLGKGILEKGLKNYVKENGLETNVTFLGYDVNPYKYVKRADLFICSSYSEGFSTAVTEALILGTPVCTTNVSGMKELLGDDEYGVITENSEKGLYDGIKKLLDDPDLLLCFKKAAETRGSAFSSESTVKRVQDVLSGL